MSSLELAALRPNAEAEHALHQPAQSKSQPTVCLAGAPNAGKTALMNALTGGSFHTANYPGVTVSLSRGKSKAEYGSQVLLVDLPGVHSTAAVSPEEELSCRVIEGRHE
ncbi:MAG TPA: FeoB small GTPase domain-containing protein, partial [Blastocatellia bacterium]